MIGYNPLQCYENLYWIQEAERDEWLVRMVYLMGPHCVNYPNTEWENIILSPPTNAGNTIVLFNPL